MSNIRPHMVFRGIGRRPCRPAVQKSARLYSQTGLSRLNNHSDKAEFHIFYKRNYHFASSTLYLRHKRQCVCCNLSGTAFRCTFCTADCRFAQTQSGRLRRMTAGDIRRRRRFRNISGKPDCCPDLRLPARLHRKRSDCNRSRTECPRNKHIRGCPSEPYGSVRADRRCKYDIVRCTARLRI